MKKIIIIIFLFSTGYLYSQHGSFGGHDSLLFDGAGNDHFFYTGGCKCKIKVLKMSGMVRGSFCEWRKEKICGEVDSGEVVVKGIIPSYQKEISDGDTIKTSEFDGSSIELMLRDGKKLFLGHNTSIVVSEDHCEKPMGLILHYGLLYLDMTGGDKNKTISIKTERGEIVNKGTKYSVESVSSGSETVDIIRVYEGSVEVKIKKSDTKDIKDVTQQMQQLNEDYKNGKITQEELIAKSKEITEKMTKAMENMRVSAVIDAGSQVTVGDVIGQTVPIENDDMWWNK